MSSRSWRSGWVVGVLHTETVVHVITELEVHTETAVHVVTEMEVGVGGGRTGHTTYRSSGLTRWAAQ